MYIWVQLFDRLATRLAARTSGSGVGVITPTERCIIIYENNNPGNGLNTCLSRRDYISRLMRGRIQVGSSQLTPLRPDCRLFLDNRSLKRVRDLLATLPLRTTWQHLPVHRTETDW